MSGKGARYVLVSEAVDAVVCVALAGCAAPIIGVKWWHLAATLYVGLWFVAVLRQRWSGE